MRHRARESRRTRPRWLIAVPVAMVIIATGVVASSAEPDPPPEAVAADAMDWWSVDAGGGRAAGGTWTVVSAIGQFDAGSLGGGSFDLDGGFIETVEPGEPPLFADGFETGDTGAWSSVSP